MGDKLFDGVTVLLLISIVITLILIGSGAFFSGKEKFTNFYSWFCEQKQKQHKNDCSSLIGVADIPVSSTNPKNFYNF